MGDTLTTAQTNLVRQSDTKTADLHGRPRTPTAGIADSRNPFGDAGLRLSERRGRDLNPRRTQRPETVFETAAFDRSATPPEWPNGPGVQGIADSTGLAIGEAFSV